MSARIVLAPVSLLIVFVPEQFLGVAVTEHVHVCNRPMMAEKHAQIFLVGIYRNLPRKSSSLLH